jgi:hypothetical protein
MDIGLFLRREAKAVLLRKRDRSYPTSASTNTTIDDIMLLAEAIEIIGILQ